MEEERREERRREERRREEEKREANVLKSTLNRKLLLTLEIVINHGNCYQPEERRREQKTIHNVPVFQV